MGYTEQIQSMKVQSRGPRMASAGKVADEVAGCVNMQYKVEAAMMP